MNLKSEIRRYVSLNTAAAETPEGVLRMWLGLPRSESALASVEAALEELVHEGVLERHALRGGGVLYRRRRGENE